MKFLNVFDVTHDKNREFWFGHLIVLTATIVGVYLAASAGLKTAIDFELIKSDRDSYYMRTALLEEVRDNVNNLESWSESYRGGQARLFMGKPDDYKLDQFIWLAMRDSPGTFEIPGEILTGIRRYYREADNTLRQMTSKQPAAKQVDAFFANSQTFKGTIMPALEKDIAELKARLDKHGIQF